MTQVATRLNVSQLVAAGIVKPDGSNLTVKAQYGCWILFTLPQVFNPADVIVHIGTAGPRIVSGPDTVLGTAQQLEDVGVPPKFIPALNKAGVIGSNPDNPINPQFHKGD